MAPKGALTDISIRNLKPGAVRREIPDPGAHGLYAIVQPSGKKGFAVRYRFGGQSRKLTLTAGISLAAARKAAADAMFEVEQGRDPAEARAQQRERIKQAKGDTLRAVAETYMHREGSGLRTADQRRNTFERLVFPVLGADTPIGSIKRKDIVRMLDHIQDENGARAADVTLAAVRKLFNWHAVRDDEFTSPIVRGMARQNAKEHERTRTLNDDELRAVWKTASEDEGAFGAFIKLALLTAGRRSEVAEMPWSELDNGDWVLPASRNKIKRFDLVRPLSKAAKEILAEQPRIDGCRYVFTFNGRTPIAGFSRFKLKFDAACGVRNWTVHDLRRTARSLMSRAGVNPDVAERCLGHVIRGVRGVYDRYEFHAEKAAAFEALARMIEHIVNPPTVADIEAERSRRRR